MHSNKIRNIEIPENLFSNLGQINRNKKNDNGIKMTNFSNHKEYRERINKMYDNFENLTPIDSEIDNVLYFNNYIEKGIVVKPKVSSLKQFWTEYRLITNEKKSQSPQYNSNSKEKDRIIEINERINEKIKEINSISNNEEKLIVETKTKEEKPQPKEKTINEKLTNFDTLFEALSQRVKEINSYIDELKEIRINIDESNNKLEKEKEEFKEEKQKFMDFKQEEENKIEEEKKNLQVNYERLQTIIDDLDKKLNEIEK